MENQVTNGLIQRLLSEGVLDKDKFAKLMAEAKHRQISFVAYLIQVKVTDSPCLLQQLLADELALPFIDLDTIDPLGLPTHLIEAELLQKYQVIPLWQDNEKLGLAMADPTQQLVIDDIRFHTGLSIQKILVDPQKLRRLLRKLRVKPSFSQDKSDKSESLDNLKPQEVLDLSYTKGLNGATIRLEGESIDVDTDVTIIQTVYKVLQSAIERDASDVHVEPYQDQLQIRFRIDGLLYLAATFPVCLVQRIITRLKIMAQLDIAERRIPQDGRFQIMDGCHRSIDCRISTCPTLFGEKLVIAFII